MLMTPLSHCGRSFLDKFSNGVIVYCSLQNTCSRLAAALKTMGYKAGAYHAGRQSTLFLDRFIDASSHRLPGAP